MTNKLKIGHSDIISHVQMIAVDASCVKFDVPMKNGVVAFN